jgi:pimeloyl-ACP methyl ester carboxylesterase
MQTPYRRVLDTPGATIYYEVRGSGPGLLIIPTGNGDGTPFAPMADALAETFTVITYDRRGFSRSPVHGPVATERRVADDVLDARLLLDRVVSAPGHVLGACSGAIVALALLERHPDRVKTLVAHEPPLTGLLPDAAAWTQFHARLYDTYVRSGPDAARDIFKARMELGPTRPPKGAELPPEQLAELLGRLRRNQVFWFEHEMRSYPEYRPDITALASAADRLILAGGEDSRETVQYQPNVIIAELLRTQVRDLPGGHLGYVTHPFEFARQFTDLLDAAG